MLLLSASSLVLMSLIFAPLSVWPVAYFCLVPWLIMIGVATHAPRVYFHSFVFGLAFCLVNMRWLSAATGPGYVALSVYLAGFFPLVACPVRHVIRRRRWRLAIAFPFVWVGSEIVRGVAFSGFPWFFLSHSQHAVLPLIQISDLVGAYGVSFVVAAINGALADLIIARMYIDAPGGLAGAVRSGRRSVAIAAALLAVSLAYGWLQLGRGTATDGPRVALIQGDFLSLVDRSRAEGHDAFTDREKMAAYLAMMKAAAMQEPDLYLLPESPWVMYLNEEARSFYESSTEAFSALDMFARTYGAYVVTGSATLERYPLSLTAKEKRYNSATVFAPKGGEPGRYDKIHLVYFGETVPFRFTRFHSVYLWLNSLMPFTGLEGQDEYSLFRGNEFRTFSLEPRSQPVRSYQFGIPICYEDVMPYVAREFVCGGSRDKRAEFLLNISNDGWFGRGVQQPQHLAICVFRAVENRVGIARSVNTGISAFIEPSGRIYGAVTRDDSNDWPGSCGYSVANVKVDARYTLYSRLGDWFAWACAAMWLVLFTDYWIVRVRTREDHTGMEP